MPEVVACLHIALADTVPTIWRRVDIPVDANLKMLHDTIQCAMGWLDCHLWDFEAGGKRYGIPDPDWDLDETIAAKNTKLASLLNRGVRQFVYTYDMGDNWEHLITVESIREGEPDTNFPRYVEGARRAPPEDVGGAPGFDGFLEAIGNPRHPEHGDVTEWHLSCYGEEFDPAVIDELNAKLGVGAIAKRRAAGKKSRVTREAKGNSTAS